MHALVRERLVLWMPVTVTPLCPRFVSVTRAWTSWRHSSCWPASGDDTEAERSASVAGARVVVVGGVVVAGGGAAGLPPPHAGKMLKHAELIRRRTDLRNMGLNVLHQSYSTSMSEANGRAREAP